MQAGVEVWLSILMSVFSGLVAVLVMVATFYVIRQNRLRRLGPGGLAAALLQSDVSHFKLSPPTPHTHQSYLSTLSRISQSLSHT